MKIACRQLLHKLLTVPGRTVSTATTNFSPSARLLVQGAMTVERTVETKVLKVPADPVNVKPVARIGAEMLKTGGVIAIPTDTLYGLAVDCQQDDAIALLYDIKGRDSQKPIAICVAEIYEIATWAEVTVPLRLLQDFLPGPVTLVFQRRNTLNPHLNPNTNLIGIRIPNHGFARELAREHGGPFALTSANPSACPSTISPEEFKSLWPRLEGVFDGGRIKPVQVTPSDHAPSEDLERCGSTVIDLSVPGHFKIIRPGILYEKSIELLQRKYTLVENK